MFGLRCALAHRLRGTRRRAASGTPERVTHAWGVPLGPSSVCYRTDCKARRLTLCVTAQIVRRGVASLKGKLETGDGRGHHGRGRRKWTLTSSRLGRLLRRAMSRLGGLKVAYRKRVLPSWLAPSRQERLMAFESERRVG